MRHSSIIIRFSQTSISSLNRFDITRSETLSPVCATASSQDLPNIDQCARKILTIAIVSNSLARNSGGNHSFLSRVLLL